MEEIKKIWRLDRDQGYDREMKIFLISQEQEAELGGSKTLPYISEVREKIMFVQARVSIGKAWLGL